MDTFKNKYRIQSARLQNWDYGSPGLYFITICTKNRKHYFGEIKNGEMVLNELGLIVNIEWEKTPEIRPDMNLELGEFITMPNHFHAVIMIGENKFNVHGGDAMHGCRDAVHGCRDAMHGVSTANKFGPQSKNLGSIIRGFKSAVTTTARKLGVEFGWQARFHDHIIRNHNELIRISNYIIANPRNWKDDKFFN
ncbi:MAG: hypothetical protein ABI472_11335 [Ginsengibacter sp.]